MNITNITLNTMKKKLLFVLAAFFMLFGTSAMAQVDSTLEGDVNEDGVVDVADIAAVIQIMKEAQGTTYYWYVGQEAVTSSNYTTLAESSSTKYTSKNYTTEKFGKLYVLTPDVVTSIKIKDVNSGGVYLSESKYSQDITFTILGYKLWVTSALGGNAPIIIEYTY